MTNTSTYLRKGWASQRQGHARLGLREAAGQAFGDADGNLTQDLNKGISSISYNHLNKPTTISFSNGTANS